MNEHEYDDVARKLAGKTFTRRQGIRALLAGVGAVALTSLVTTPAVADPTCVNNGLKESGGNKCCSGCKDSSSKCKNCPIGACQRCDTCCPKPPAAKNTNCLSTCTCTHCPG